MAFIRLLASFGAGGVIYLTPIVFHQASFTAVQVSQGLAASALIGTVARLLSGVLLDRGLTCSWPVRAAALLALMADLVLFQATGFNGYLVGQLLIGVAAGLYFPAIELAVPLSCSGFNSSRGYALARSADALGVAAGALLGAVLTAMDMIRMVYAVEAAAVLSMLVVLLLTPLPDGRAALLHPSTAASNNHELNPEAEAKSAPEADWRWLLPLIPVLIVSVIATGIVSLMQSALPLDMVRGGLARAPLSEASSGGFIAWQLLLLMVLQWPIGNWVAKRSLRFGLGMGLLGFITGCLLLAGSALWAGGSSLIALAMVPIAFGEAAFLPTAAEAMVEETPLQHRGLAMALFSQCFAISAIAAPLLAGALLDQQGHGLVLWLLMAGTCLLVVPLLKAVRPRYKPNLSGSPIEEALDATNQRTAALH
ncbi:MFS transporter [Synechococcus sp. WH 8016]|uniref:MFS transporter n=1 Tax=Synechococcus sp. WH 8016 TaxID=166318 RepID=UPI00022D9B6E|nr:major facilitator superfamily MFS_1 [Synechococcus sp. WH 8016]